jgi:hypothetical protein
MCAHTHTLYTKKQALSVIGTDVALQANTEKTKLLPELRNIRNTTALSTCIYI